MAAGQILHNRYRLDAEIGAGGMGTVYRGVDTRTNQTVAIKHLKPELTRPDLIERFRREGEALRELNHPNIVKLLDTIEADGNHYLVMEYVSGGDLNDLLKRKLPDINRVVQLALDLADALTRAHRLNIIHRDLKPANVLIAEDGTPRLTDFGVAHMGSKQRVTETDALIGTMDYLAPETLNGEAIDERADIWAFGVMLFEMLAGKRPFSGNSIGETVTHIMTMPTPDLEKLRDDAPIALVDLVYRMLEKNREARIRSVRQVGLELESILRGDAPVLERFSTPTPVFSDRPRHNLPAQTTEFVGREHELAELAKLIDNPKTRLVTILAPGGMGKTRLALEAAERALLNFANGVFFVDLAPLSDPANIAVAVVDALDFELQAGERTPEQQILDYLANKHLLLIMDNYEHLLAGGGLVANILKAAPQIQILVTSRQRLNQTGETIFNLEGMDFPAWETPEDALEYAAVKLFMQSARRARPNFELTLENMEYLALICKLVFGMPLGILLAASWLGMLSSEEIAQEIEKSIDFLAGDMADLPERQRSIRAVFDYSWQLMSEAEKQVFMKLSVFRSGFTREAVEAVAGANLRVLMSLMNKSLIRRDVERGRYDIHELLRQYGEEKLVLAGELDSSRDAHSAYFLDFLAERLPDVKGRRQREAILEIDADFENIKVAWQRGVDRKEVQKLDSALDTLYIYCEDRKKHGVEGQQLLKYALDQFESDQAHTFDRFRRRIRTRFFDSVELKLHEVEGYLQAARETNDLAEIAFYTALRGSILLYGQKDDMAAVAFDEAMEQFRALPDPFFVGRWLFQVCLLARFHGDIDKGLRSAHEAYQIQQAIGDKIGEIWILGALTLFIDDEREYANSLEKCLQVCQETDNYSGTLNLLFFKMILSVLQGDFAMTRSLAEECFSIGRKYNIWLGEVGFLGLAWLACMEGNYQQARQDAQESRKRFLDFAHQEVYALTLEAVINFGLKDYAAARHSNHLALARLHLERAKRDMLANVPVSALLAAHDGQFTWAAELLGLAFNHRYAVTGWLYQWDLVAELRSDLEHKLGADDFASAWERGAKMDLETVVKALLGQ